MLYHYRKGKNASQTISKICAVYGAGTVSKRVCQNWFSKFRAGDTSCQDNERSGRPSAVDDDQIKALIENNPRYTTREIAGIVKASPKTVTNHLRALGYRYGECAILTRDGWRKVGYVS